MNNKWNKIIYKLWSKIYDIFFNSGAFLKARKKVFQDYPFKKGQKVLFVGVGTGADLELINLNDLEITGIDLSKDMLEQAKKKFSKTVILKEMDAMNLDFSDETFDVIVSSLIVSVVPDPVKAIKEMNRVLKSDGEIVIFDKFSESHKTSLLKKVARNIVRFLGTDIGLDFSDVLKKSDGNLAIIDNQPVMFKGLYRKIILKRSVV
ncbi:class I SAM-dependent methyltransferase [Cytobacillus sp. FJAT-54145]|uniref:Class I SAM-dependent methyltransferase n=1 Tax=Cytobacillus spartinae TaxID=3299023 RepID=A0ABW6KDL6_9BACI